MYNQLKNSRCPINTLCCSVVRLWAVVFVVFGQTNSFAFAPHKLLRIPNLSATPTPAACTVPNGGSSPTIHCYDPAMLMEAYGIDRLHQVGLTGKGQTIILVDSYGSPTMQADLDAFSKTFGINSTTIEFVYPNGPYTNPLTTTDQISWAEETSLDVEWAHAVAPDAKIVNVVTSSDETQGMAGMQDLFNGIQMAAQKYPNAVISLSFGTGEPTFTSAQVETYLRGEFHQILKEATANGVTFLAAAGDWGTANYNLAWTSYLSFQNVLYPASDPLVTAVGGTQLQYNWTWAPQGTADDYWSCVLAQQNSCNNNFLNWISTPNTRIETVWKEDWAIVAGGGGVSTVFKAPEYQSSLSPEIQQTVNGYRGVPDMAMNAGENGGIEVYMGFSIPSQGVTGPAWGIFGGTSCATPETAGLIALADQAASQLVGSPVGIGPMNRYIYSMGPWDFHDIVPHTFGAVTLDNNALYYSLDLLNARGPLSVPPVPVPGQKTTEGYDLTSGFGSPNAPYFVIDLANAAAANHPSPL
jgi:subtilase family serine protease